MNSLNGFLLKFNTLLKTSRDSKKVALEVIQKVAGIELEDREIEIKRDVLCLYTNPVIKNEIYMRKALILSELTKTLGNRAPREIR